jgi:hypothetical protein
MRVEFTVPEADDLAFHLSRAKNVKEGFLSYAYSLETAAKLVREVSEKANFIRWETHSKVEIYLPDDIAQDLLDRNLVRMVSYNYNEEDMYCDVVEEEEEYYDDTSRLLGGEVE